jgi:hypothetical protein
VVELEGLVGRRDFGWGDQDGRVTRSGGNYVNYIILVIKRFNIT